MEEMTQEEKDILKACENYRQASQEYDEACKYRESARDYLLKITGKQPFAGNGVKISKTPEREAINWKLAMPALNITQDMVKPFTSIRLSSLRVTVEREIVINNPTE